MDHLVMAPMDEVLRLDDAGEPHAIIGSLLRRSTDIEPLLAALIHLMKHDRFETAGHIADQLVRVGVDDPTAHLARAFGGLFGNVTRLDPASVAALVRHIDAMSRERRMAFYQDIFFPPFFRVMTIGHHHDNIWVLMQLSEILKACAPEFRDVFDWSAAPAPMPRSGSDRPSLIAYRSPPPNAPRVPRRVVIAIRERFIMPITITRLLDTGPRFIDAFTRYGWSAEQSTMRFVDLPADLREVVKHCVRVSADVLILDGDIIGVKDVPTLLEQTIDLLRSVLPNIKIVALHLDAWQLPPDLLRANAPNVDAIWSCTPSRPHWADPVFADKVLHLPIPQAGHARAPDETAPDRLTFVGGLMGYNWPRVLWRAAAIWHKLPIDWQLTFHTNDDVPILDSYADYMRRVAESRCALNLSMRKDLTSIVTGRSFEAMLMGNLLVQEATPCLDYFFTPGEHCLAFRTFADLRAVAEFVTNEPEAAQKIRRAGYEFAIQRYSDEKLIGYLDAMLFHPVAGEG